MRLVAVIGAGGFVGQSIAREVANSADCRLVPVMRGQNLAEAVRECEVVIHAANPAGRFHANRDPQRDYQETVEKTSQVLEVAEGRKCILVSSLSCRTQTSTPYGRNRLECERLALDAGATVVRLGPMYGGMRVKDTLHDILAHNSKLIITIDQCHSFDFISESDQRASCLKFFYSIEYLVT